MKKLANFIQAKGFYLALGVGIIAFAGLIFLYDYEENETITNSEQIIDLNEPATDEDTNNNVSDNDHIAPINDTAENTTTEAPTNNHVADSTKSTAEPATPESDLPDTVAAESEGAYPEPEISLSYDGSKTLNWPVDGEIIIPYSMDTTVYFETLDSYKCCPGVLIAGEEGKMILSAYEGVVESITEDRELGTVVTVDMGNGYKAIYGQLMNIAVSEGESITKAENLGQIGPATSYYKKEGSHLFFQITKDGEPIDPTTLIQ